jgi:uncharacterized iron-regulated membrane protein
VPYFSEERDKETDLRKWHRLMGIWAGPLMILQAASGIFLSVDWLMGIHHRIGDASAMIFRLSQGGDVIPVEIHYGIGKAEAFYHIALGVAVIGMGVSGFILFLRARKRQRAVLRKTDDIA